MRTHEVSRLAKSGESRTCHAMVGTPPKIVTRSRSISSRARSGLQRRIITSLPPAAVFGTSTEWQPVAWNSGTESSEELCAGPSGGADPLLLVRQQAAAGVDEAEADEVRADVALGPERPLRLARRPRGVEDRGVVLRLDLRPVAGRSPASVEAAEPAAGGEDVLVSIVARPPGPAGPPSSEAGDDDVLEPAAAQVVEVGRQPCADAPGRGSPPWCRSPRARRRARARSTRRSAGRRPRRGPPPAQKATTHSGRLRMAIATRSPVRTP